MSEGKLAAQVGHVCKELGRQKYSDPKEDIIVVLGLRQNKFSDKFFEMRTSSFFYAQVDLGLTEVDRGTVTVFGYINE